MTSATKDFLQSFGIYFSSSSEAVKMWLGELKYIGIDKTVVKPVFQSYSQGHR